MASVVIEEHFQVKRGTFWRALIMEGDKMIDAYESDWPSSLRSMVLASTYGITPLDYRRAAIDRLRVIKLAK